MQISFLRPRFDNIAGFGAALFDALGHTGCARDAARVAGVSNAACVYPCRKRSVTSSNVPRTRSS